jgi:hypothetical protein
LESSGNEDGLEDEDLLSGGVKPLGTLVNGSTRQRTGFTGAIVGPKISDELDKLTGQCWLCIEGLCVVAGLLDGGNGLTSLPPRDGGLGDTGTSSRFSTVGNPSVTPDLAKDGSEMIAAYRHGD